MLTVSKKIIIFRKADASEFSKKNYKVLPSGINKIGSSINAVNKIMVHSDMLGELMPGIVGTSTKDNEFTKKVNHYWNSIAVNVSDTGKELEIGFIYDLADSVKSVSISKIKGADGKLRKFTTEQELADYVEEHIPEEDHYRYGKPISAADYLLWRYCLNYKAVANNPDEVTLGLSTDIRFYIHNEGMIKKMEAKKFQLRSTAGKIYFDVIADPADVKKYLYAMGEGAGIEAMDDIDRSKVLERIYMDQPAKLVAVHKDKQRDLIAYVEECIHHGVLRRLPNTDVIVNSTDNTPIGDNMQDVIAFLKSDSNAKVANEIKGRLKAIPKI